jgi:predicted RNase H-like HicB family nuclease
MRYPLVIHHEPDSAFGVTVPDLPGCFSAGDTIDEALTFAREAILGHVHTLIETGQDVPRPRPIDEHRGNPDFQGAALWAVVEVDLSNLPGKARRINISMNERVLDVVDEFARREGETRSGLIQRAVTVYVADRRAATPATPAAKSRRAVRARR